MKRPYLDEFQRMILTKAPDTLSAAQIRLNLAFKVLGREILKPAFKLFDKFIDALNTWHF